MIVTFPPRTAHTVAALATRRMATDPRCTIVLTKDDRERRYVIRSDRPGSWIGEVWFGVALHRNRVVFGVHDARMLVDQFVRELTDLLRDGWREA